MRLLVCTIHYHVISPHAGGDFNLCPAVACMVRPEPRDHHRHRCRPGPQGDKRCGSWQQVRAPAAAASPMQASIGADAARASPLKPR